MVKIRAVCFFLVAMCFASTAFAADQFFPEGSLKSWDRDNVAGGQGTLYGRFSFTRNDAAADQAIKEIGWMTLQPGASIGMHEHKDNEDTYIIVSGEGAFIDSEGKEHAVKAGDITIARKGQAHSLLNTGKEPLVFLDIIAAQQ